jgi:hypothetical protein
MEFLLNLYDMMVYMKNGRIRRGWCALDLEIWFDRIVHDHASFHRIWSEALTPHSYPGPLEMREWGVCRRNDGTFSVSFPSWLLTPEY